MRFRSSLVVKILSMARHISSVYNRGIMLK